jgi:hypothetical protein
MFGDERLFCDNRETCDEGAEQQSKEFVEAPYITESLE